MVGAFCMSAGLLICLRLILMSDLWIWIIYAPHDDSLYVTRALHFLNGAGFGPYDSRVLAKLPGMSLWLAGLRSLGLPYLLGLNLLYVTAGLYMLWGLRRSGVGRAALCIVFALYLFNPVTMGAEWIRTIREPPSTVLLVATMAAMLHVLVLSREGKSSWAHLIVLSALLAFSMLVREEDRLLWALFVLFLGALWKVTGIRLSRLAVVALVPALSVLASNYAARQMVEGWYGLPILHDYGEGEYPRMLAAIRGIVTAKDNRLVMVTQEALAKLKAEVPEFAPVVDRLPPLGPESLSCRLQGVCSEWSNGWMPFWIKDAAADAGLTPTLPAAQTYFRLVRERIEASCSAGRLQCVDRGQGFLPPFELRWTRAYVQEFKHLLGMAIAPHPDKIAYPMVRFKFSTELGRTYRAVTMTHGFDALGESGLTGEGGRLVPNPLAPLRAAMRVPFQLLAALVLVASLAALAYRWARSDALPPGPLLWIATVFFVFAAIRMAALAYVGIRLGPFDPRIVFSTYVVALVFAPLLLLEAMRAHRAWLQGIK